MSSAFATNSKAQDVTVSSGTLDLAGNNLTVNDVFTISGSATVKLQGGETVSTGNNAIGDSTTVEYTGTRTYTSLALGNSYGNVKFTSSGNFTHNGALDLGGALTIGTAATLQRSGSGR